MSNVAPPVPKLLKTVGQGKGLYNKRLENNRRLLQWAIDYLQEMTNDLEDCNSDPDGTIQGRDIYIEIKRCRKWLTQARQVVA